MFVLESDSVLTLLEEAFGIIGFEVAYDPFERKIGKEPMVHHIFHVPFSLGVHRLKQSVRPAIEVCRQHSELLAQFDVECRRRFHPSAIDIKERIAVVEKEILPAHRAPKLFGAEVILYVGEADRSRDTYGPRASH